MIKPKRRNFWHVRAMFLLSLSALVGGGCSSVQKSSPGLLEAIRHNQRGIEEEARGNTDAAVAEFTAALRLHGAIENNDGMVVALINIARTKRLKGDLVSARAAIERATLLLQEPSSIASELFFEKAKISMAMAELLPAKDWALRAVAADKGKGLGRRINLAGRILLQQGLTEEARVQAELALTLNRDEDAAGEEANSLRLLGEILLAQGDYRKAVSFFQDALALDKKLGAGKKIAEDLRGLGAATLKYNDLAAAIGFYRRALEVSLNNIDPVSAADDMAKLAGLYRKRGELLLALEIEAERARILNKQR